MLSRHLIVRTSEQVLFTSSTSSLFQRNDNDRLTLEEPNIYEQYLFPDCEEITGSTTSDLFADIDLSELKGFEGIDPNQSMEMIDGATLFKVDRPCFQPVFVLLYSIHHNIGQKIVMTVILFFHINLFIILDTWNWINV